ncbi:MAG: ATP-binding protein [Clostridiales bacterium]|jgi:predicted AAA+ superfamily ATPase|nr:ATP-binding protein [Clostridiales bacterium]
MLQRKFINTLLEWKHAKHRECLLVKGARQIGKTYIIREFAKANYSNFIEINFLRDVRFKDAFEQTPDLSFASIFSRLTLIDSRIRFVPNQTLLFIDEIQECGSARTALKFIAEEDRIDCIASGSMLGIAYKKTASIPVGYERQIEMFSLDFEEYLWAKGYDSPQLSILRGFFDKKEKVPTAVNDTMLRLLREYMAVGGMPYVVQTYIDTNSYALVFEEQSKIISSYLDDIAKYASESEKPKARNCYLSIPRQLAKETTKFQYSVVEKGGTSRKFDNSLDWLNDAGLIKFCKNVSLPIFPLKAYTKDDQFKVYLSDMGLLTAMYDFDMKAAVINNTLIGPAKGGIYENLIADMLFKKNRPLNYYKNDNNTQEIEFLLTENAAVIPIEVKSGNGSTISLNEITAKFNPPYALKFVTGNVGVSDKKITYPLYMAMFL